MWSVSNTWMSMSNFECTRPVSWLLLPVIQSHPGHFAVLNTGISPRWIRENFAYATRYCLRLIFILLVFCSCFHGWLGSDGFSYDPFSKELLRTFLITDTYIKIYIRFIDWNCHFIDSVTWCSRNLVGYFELFNIVVSRKFLFAQNIFAIDNLVDWRHHLVVCCQQNFHHVQHWARRAKF